jgi:hypothetical protein
MAGGRAADGALLRRRRGAAADHPQNWKNPDNMTWLDYRKPPGTSWADPNASGSVRTFRGALVLLDYPNQPFVVTQPQGTTIFGNPSAEASAIPRAQVAQFYRGWSVWLPNELAATGFGRTATCLAVAR